MGVTHRAPVKTSLILHLGNAILVLLISGVESLGCFLLPC